MKLKAILIVFATVATAAVAGNYFYGKNVSKSLDEALQKRLTKMNGAIELKYEHIDVNPFRSKVTFEGVKYRSKQQQLWFDAEVIDVSIPYAEAMRLLNEEHFEELNSLKIFVEKIDLLDKRPEVMMSAESLTIDFDGCVTKHDFDSLEYRFPDLKQMVELDMRGVNGSGYESILKNVPLPAFVINDIDRLDAKLCFNPEKHELELCRFLVRANEFELETSGVAHLEGNGMRKVKVVDIDMKADADLELSEYETTTGERLNLSSLDLKATARWEEQNGKLKGVDSKVNMLVENFSSIRVNKKGHNKMIIPVVNIKMDSLEVSRLAVNFTNSDGKLIVENSELKSSILNLKVDGKVDDFGTKKANIEHAMIVASDMSEDVDRAINDLEMLFGKKLPREDGKIILDMSGAFSKPKIKGLEL